MIELNYRDSRPIYEQVKDGLRKLVVTGAISPGDKLPSVRQMASQLAINPNTIQKAYEALEQEGYVYSVPGKGSFAAPQSEMDGRRREELFQQLDAITEELRYLGVTAEEIAAHCAGKKEEKP
jgi:GntR family transcriptional regulator